MSDLERFKELIDIKEIATATRESTPNHFTTLWLSSSLTIISATFPSSVTQGKVSFRFPLLPAYQNPTGTLHGGAQSTFFDVCTSWNLAMVAKPGFWLSLGTTRTLVVNCLRPGAVGEWAVLESEIVQVGKRMALIRATLRRERDGAVISTCEHNKYNIDADVKM